MDDRFERIEIVPDEMGNKAIPYFFTYLESEDEWLVGEEAKSYASANPDSTFYEVKQVINDPYSIKPTMKRR